MLKLALIAITALPLFAGFFPSTVNTSVANTSGQTLSMHRSFPVNGMSGVVIHNYGNDVKAITTYVVQTAPGQAKLAGNDILQHDELPTIKTAVAKGDKIIGGYLYNNVLLLAPDASVYAKITSGSHKTWIHPDLFALYLTQEGEGVPTRKNLSDFAKRYHVGLIYIVKKSSAVLLDPISGKIISKRPFSSAPGKAQYPFFMRFDKIDTGWFSKTKTGNYYNLMETL